MSFLKHAGLALLIAFNHSSVFASQEVTEFNIKLTDYSAGINNDLCAKAQVATQPSCFHTISLSSSLAQALTEQTSRKHPIPANDWISLNEMVDFTQNYNLLAPVWFDEINAAYRLNRAFNDANFENLIIQNKLTNAKNAVDIFLQRLEAQHMMSAYMEYRQVEQLLTRLRSDFMYSSPIPNHSAINVINELEQELIDMKENINLFAYDETNAPLWVKTLNSRLTQFSNAVTLLPEPDNETLANHAIAALNAAYPLNMGMHKAQLNFDAILLQDVSPHPLPATMILADLNAALTLLEQALATEWHAHFSQSLPSPTTQVQLSITSNETMNQALTMNNDTQLLSEFIATFKQGYAQLASE